MSRHVDCGKEHPIGTPCPPKWYEDWELVTWSGESNGLKPGWYRKEILLPHAADGHKEINVYVETGSETAKAVSALESALMALSERDKEKEAK